MKDLKFLRATASRAGVPPEVDDKMATLLEKGTLAVEGLLPWGSNYTFLGRVTDGECEARVVYKPVRGERPLWDFPHGTLALPSNFGQMRIYLKRRRFGYPPDLEQRLVLLAKRKDLR